MKNIESPKFQLNYKKSNLVDISYLEKEFEKTKTEEHTEMKYNPYSITKLQNYNSIYSVFFDLNETDYNSIGWNQKYDIVDLETVVENPSKKEIKTPVFIKFSPLLDATRYMVGKYDTQHKHMRTLPSPNNKDCHSKILNPHNASYVDCFFSFLSSILLNHHDMIHGIDFYGSFLGIQSKFKVDISDDLEYLYNSSFFTSQLNKLFTITKKYENPFSKFGSRTNKIRLNISKNISEISILSIMDIDSEKEKIEPTDEKIEIQYCKKDSISSLSSKSLSTSYDSSDCSDINYSSEDDDEEEEEDNDDENEDEDNDDENEDNDEDNDDEDKEYNDEDKEYNDEDEEDNKEEEEEQVFSYINDFPIQMICLEKCDGTMDDLFENHYYDDIISASALFQIIMTLLVYQKAFHFTHNDLHTNNIMYKNTTIRYLYYHFNGIYYKVPTHGKIYKIIDFGRGIYTFQKQLFCSDSFSSTGDATTQYNFGPFMNENKPVLEPNYSFDLCRLGCSIYDFIIDDEDMYEDLDEFQKTIYRWCTDDNGKNILYMKNGEERYPNFKLYKMIARTVHNHTPQQQLQFPFFKQFEISMHSLKKKKEGEKSIINIDKLPCYV